MKKLFLVVLAIIAFQNFSFAKIRRVGFFAPPVTGTDYSTFALAYTAATIGDTILVFPGIPAINQIFTKKIIIIGPGSWLNPNSTPKGNANLQAFAGTVGINSLTFNAGSEGSVVMGLEGGTINVSASNITIRRNREIVVYIAIVNVVTAITNLQVLENYRVNIANYYANGSSFTNMNISNNLITSFSTAPLNTYSGNISNNLWAFDNTLTAPANGGATALTGAYDITLGGGAYLFQNNILVCYTSASLASNYNYFPILNGTNTVFNNNLALQTGTGPSQAWGTGTGNVITPVANAANIFDGFPAIGSFSADARYKLKSGSPASTAGAGGTPIGMFAGSTPFKLGLVPTIPSIYLLTSPQGNNPPGNTIQINVSTRGNN
ncbi:MAG: hypothetical protein ABI760_16335 [Ferruginibacter sp.]